MKGLFDLVDRAKKLSEGRVFLLTFDNPDLKSLVIKLNLDQLRVGTLSNDTTIPFVYSEESIARGKRPGPWTLFDTGELYDSFKVVQVTQEYILEYADLIKEDGDGGADFEEAFERYGSVIGLDTESRTILQNQAIPIMQEIILNELLSK